MQSLKRSGHKSLRALPSNQLSYLNNMVALFLKIFEEQDLKGDTIDVMPTQKKNLFLDGE